MNFEDYIKNLKTIGYEDILNLVQNAEKSNNIVFNLKRGMYEVVDIFDEHNNYEDSYLFVEQDETKICEDLYNKLVNSNLDVKFEYSEGININYYCEVNGSFINFPREKCLKWINNKIEEEQEKGNSPTISFL